MRRRLATSAVELAGFGCVVYSGWRVSTTVGFLIAGLVLVLIGWLLA